MGLKSCIPGKNSDFRDRLSACPKGLYGLYGLYGPVWARQRKYFFRIINYIVRGSCTKLLANLKTLTFPPLIYRGRNPPPFPLHYKTVYIRVKVDL
jgi:hypothetical protein